MRAWLLVLMILSAVPGCARERDWAGVQTFACQFQKLQVGEIRASNLDLLITDYAGEAGPLKPAQVEALKGGRRLVVAYLSVGEAEDYRFYWRPEFRTGHPAWLGPSNPDWKGNYRVFYENPEWRAILETYLQAIVAAGFDGVFLDRVDAFEEQGGPQAAARMASLVQRLAQQARTQGGPDFGVFPNNGEALLADPQYLAAITGIVKEELFFGDGGPTPGEVTRRARLALEPARAAGKLILSIDYTQQLEQQREACRQASAAGYREYIGTRNLDRLVLQPAPLEETGWRWALVLVGLLGSGGIWAWRGYRKTTRSTGL